MAIAGIDFGRKRIGLAITEGQSAYPLSVMERRSLKADLEEIRARLLERQVSLIVVGLPLNMDGTEGPSARAARAFAQRLGLATGLPTAMFDERLTSFEAEQRLREAAASRAVKRVALDAVAAVVILEGWLQSHPNEPYPR
jgi:putative pre-16S rRNA nuclease